MAFNAKGEKPAGFTMAEILLSLTIIGVVAAITLPSLTGNINERTWNTQRKALYARMSQAIALMPALNGFGTLETVSNSGSTSINDTAAETFITSGLAKVLKINNICDNEHIEDCGIVSQITTLNGSTISTPTTMQQLNYKMLTGSYSAYGAHFSFLNTKGAAFETANGESILAFYNPNCLPDMNESSDYYMQSKICANFIFDLNGNKGPNTVGKDIGFITILYPTDSSVVAPNVPVQFNIASKEISTCSRSFIKCLISHIYSTTRSSKNPDNLPVSYKFFTYPGAVTLLITLVSLSKSIDLDFLGISIFIHDTPHPISFPTSAGMIPVLSVNGNLIVNPIGATFPGCTSGMILILASL